MPATSPDAQALVKVLTAINTNLVEIGNILKTEDPIEETDASLSAAEIPVETYNSDFTSFVRVGMAKVLSDGTIELNVNSKALADVIFNLGGLEQFISFQLGIQHKPATPTL